MKRVERDARGRVIRERDRDGKVIYLARSNASLANEEGFSDAPQRGRLHDRERGHLAHVTETNMHVTPFHWRLTL